MFKIKTLNKIAESGLERLEEEDCAAGSDMPDPDGILVRSFNMHDYVFNPELLAVARAGAGINNIPVDRCTKEGIAVFNTPGANAEAVKELAVCALLMASRDVVGGVEWVRSIAGNGDEVAAMVELGKSSFAGPEISGKTLGVVGLGAIGARIANIALEFGMKVYGFDPYLSVDAAWQLSREVTRAHDIDTVYKNCDYITLHIPYLPATHGMINEDALSKMREGVRLINLARGELVCDEDLIAALDTAKVARYVTDFPNGQIAGLPNVVPLPHLGASTPESEEKCAEMAAAELCDYLKNGNVKNSVNLPPVFLDRIGISRLCVIHLNVPRVITRILDLIGGLDINVEHMINKQRGEYAYTIIDTGTRINGDISENIRKMKEVIRVRILQNE
ncbi:MAG: 3-phosphoglycerate dehydrogenase family protein [Oscillospiraceae bacterium]|nr:3-phosphoglycerate dehydrogenase family protein [Oscillospiraceae bacterium]